jgi:hypothetical protein
VSAAERKLQDVIGEVAQLQTAVEAASSQHENLEMERTKV